MVLVVGTVLLLASGSAFELFLHPGLRQGLRGNVCGRGNTNFKLIHTGV